MNPQSPSAQLLLFIVRVKYRISGLLCVIFVEVVIGTAVPSVQPGTRSVIIVAKNVKVNDIVARALIDTGSTNIYLSKSLVDQNHITYTSLRFVANMANTSLKTEIHGICNVKLQFSQHAYEQVKFSIMPEFASDVICHW